MKWQISILILSCIPFIGFCQLEIIPIPGNYGTTIQLTNSDNYLWRIWNDRNNYWGHSNTLDFVSNDGYICMQIYPDHHVNVNSLLWVDYDIKIFHGQKATLKGAANFDFNPYSYEGLVIEQGYSEGSGFYADGDFATIWSPGDQNRLLRVYDEDGMIEKWYLDGSGYAHTLSDFNAKENVRSIASGVNLLSKIQGVQYNYKKEDQADITETTLEASGNEVFDSSFHKNDPIIDSNKYDPSHKEYYGFIAQDVAKIFPDIVDTDEHGTMYISYDQFIPLLVEAVKEQQTEIELLRSEISSLKSESTIKSISFINQTPTEINEAEPVLYQNIPNPYSEGTIIKYYLPDGLSEADIIIFDMKGKQMKSFSLNTPGESSIKISSSELQPGMFMYTMVVDGKIIDTKQMIMTK